VELRRAACLDQQLGVDGDVVRRVTRVAVFRMLGRTRATCAPAVEHHVVAGDDAHR
jgi:hypothetical protein